MWTLWAAAVLFVVFGIKMAQEAREMQASHLADEMREVEEELEEDTAEHDPNSVQLENLEEGRARPLENSLSAPSRDGSPAPGRNMRSSSRTRSRSLSPSRRMRPSISLGGGVGPLKIKEETMLAWRDTARNALEMMTNPVFAQAFALTFLGEWGDRSQITTIAMAGAHVSPPGPRFPRGFPRPRRGPSVEGRQLRRGELQLTPVRPRRRLRHHPGPLALHPARGSGRKAALDKTEREA